MLRAAVLLDSLAIRPCRLALAGGSGSEPPRGPTAIPPLKHAIRVLTMHDRLPDTSCLSAARNSFIIWKIKGFRQLSVKSGAFSDLQLVLGLPPSL